MLLVIEGVDGAGKTTQAERLRDHLEGEGRSVALFREPGGTYLGEEVRKILLGHRKDDMSMEAEFLLYMTARAQLLQESVRPAIADGKVVILDRYFYSTAAYQGEAGGLGAKTVLDVCARLHFDTPDHVFLLDLDPGEAFQRGNADKDRIESRGIDYFQRVRKAFLDIAKSEPGLFTVLDASHPADEIQAGIRESVSRLL